MTADVQTNHEAPRDRNRDRLRRWFDHDYDYDYDNIGRAGPARTACATAGYNVADHFFDVTRDVEVGKGGTRSVPDVWLTRYACYLITQNGDPSKDAIAFAQTYFAVQARKQEVTEQRLAEAEHLRARKKLTESE